MIKLNPLPRSTPIKINIQVLPDLKEKLDDYVTIYAQTYGKSDPLTDLIPHMLEAFLESDVAFKKARRDLQSQTEKSPDNSSKHPENPPSPEPSTIRSALSFTKE
jgi:hypothetical protein